MDGNYDVVVVGGGPGGATAASFLGRAGVKTLLLDKARFPRDKSCGDAVCSRSVYILRELGLERKVAQAGSHRADNEVFVNLRGDALRLPFVPERDGSGASTSDSTPAYVIARKVFDDILFQFARSYDSVTTEEEFTVTDLLREGEKVVGVVGKTADGAEARISAKVVIGADGAMSKVAERVGAYDFHHKQHDHWIAAFRIYFEGIDGLGEDLEIHFLDDLIPGYLWIFPMGNGRANVGAGMVETFVRGDKTGKKIQLRQLSYRLLAEHPRLKGRFGGATEQPNSFLGWQLPCGSERRRLAGDGWMLVGDAGSLIDPFSGEGIANAMESGKMAAHAAVHALESKVSDGLGAYENAVWAELGQELATSYRMQKLVRRKWLVNFVVHRAATRPRVRKEICDIIAHREKAKQLFNPLFYMKMLTL